MKKLFALILAVLSVFMLNTAAYCADGISFKFEYSGDELRQNWGFDIYFNAKSDTNINISALRLDIYFDNAELKFLSAESEADISSYEPESGVVRIVWLNSSGQCASSEGKRLFTVRFKPLSSVSSASYDFSSKITEAVSYDAEYLSAESSPCINISKSGSSSTYSSSDSSKGSSSSNSSGNSESSINSESEKSSAEASGEDASLGSEDSSDSEAESRNNYDTSIGDRKTINSENGFAYFMLGAGGTLFIGAAVFFAYMFGKKHGGK